MIVTKRDFQKAKRAKKWTPGRDRTGGTYGRFTGRAGEMKFLDKLTSSAVLSPANDILVDTLNNLSQGTSPSQRIGRKITIRSIQVKLAGVKDTTTNGGYGTNYVEVWVVQDTQCNGTGPAAGTEVASQLTPSMAFNNLDNSDRFKILKKIRIKVESQGGAEANAALAQTYHHDFYKKVNIPVVYSTNVGNISDIRSNNIFLMGGKQYNQSGETLTMTILTRIRYTDD